MLNYLLKYFSCKKMQLISDPLARVVDCCEKRLKNFQNVLSTMHPKLSFCSPVFIGVYWERSPRVFTALRSAWNACHWTSTQRIQSSTQLWLAYRMTLNFKCYPVSRMQRRDSKFSSDYSHTKNTLCPHQMPR